MRASLAPGTRIDADRGRHRRVEEDQDQWMLRRAQDDAADRIVDGVDAENTAALRQTQELHNNGANTAHARRLPTMRELMGGIRGTRRLADVVGQARAAVMEQGWRAAMRTAAAHAWDVAEACMPITDPLGHVEAGCEPCADGRLHVSYWRGGGSKDGWDETMDDAINRDPVLRLWQRSSALEVEAGRGVRDKTGAQVTSDEQGRRVLKKRGTLASWRVCWLTVCLHLRHHFTHAAACDASHTHRCPHSTGIQKFAHRTCSTPTPSLSPLSIVVRFLIFSYRGSWTTSQNETANDITDLCRSCFNFSAVSFKSSGYFFWPDPV